VEAIELICRVLCASLISSFDNWLRTSDTSKVHCVIYSTVCFIENIGGVAWQVFDWAGLWNMDQYPCMRRHEFVSHRSWNIYWVCRGRLFCVACISTPTFCLPTTRSATASIDVPLIASRSNPTLCFRRQRLVLCKAATAQRRQDSCFGSVQHLSSPRTASPSHQNASKPSSVVRDLSRVVRHWAINAPASLSYITDVFFIHGAVCAQLVVNSAVTLPPDWLLSRLYKCNAILAGLPASTWRHIELFS